MTATQRLSVAIIIPTYNRADLLPQTIDSLLHQTRPPDEIIVVDDGSTDNTPEVLAQYKDSVIAIHKRNGGPSSARNEGLKIVRSDLIAFLDSDDTLYSSNIEERVTLLENAPAFDVVYSNVQLVNKNGQPMELYTDFLPGIRPSGNVFASYICRNWMPLHAFMFRRHCLEQVSQFDEAIFGIEDYDFWLRMAGSYTFCYLDKPLAGYRIHEQTVTSLRWEQTKRDEVKIRERGFAMPAFQALSPRQQATAYSIQGSQHFLLGEPRVARHWYRRALQMSPGYFRVYALYVLTFLGRALFQWMARAYGKRRM